MPISYKKYGDSKSPAILILHGWGRHQGDWSSVAQQLSHKYCVYTIDLPGFGGTPIVSDEATIYDYANYVKGFAKEMQLDEFIVMGQSFGGRIGIILASEPDCRVRKLVLVDAAGLEHKSFIYKLRIFGLKVLTFPLKLVLSEGRLQKIKNSFGSSNYKSAGELRKIFVNVVNQDLSHHLKDIKVQTLIIWGDKDDVLPVSDGVYLRDNISNSTLRIVWGAGHHPHLEKNESFMEILNEFI